DRALFVDEWRIGFMAGEPALVDEYMGVLLASRRNPDPEQVWRWLAKARAALGAAGRRRAPETSAALKQKSSELQGELEACYARLTSAWPQERGRAGRFATRAIERRAFRLETRLRRLAAISATGRGPRARRKPGEPNLAHDGALLAYCAAGGRLGALCRQGDRWWMARDLASLEEVDRELRLFHYQMNARGLGPAGSGARERCSMERSETHLA